MTFSVYKIPFPNGKHYIGITNTSIEQRKKQHKCSAKNGNTRYVYNAIRKYNMVDTLELIEIDTADTLEELCEKEKKYIIEYNSYYMNKNGYNMTHGGEGTNGYIYTEYDNKKNSERIKKYYKEHPDAGNEHSERLKLHFKEHPEAIQIMSEISKKHWDNPYVRERQSERLKLYFKEHPETIQQMSEISKKHFENPEARQQISEKIKKHFENPEAIEKCSKAQKKRFENPEARQQLSESQKKRFENPDTRKKTSDGKGKNKPFDVFTLDGTFIKTFTYQFEAREYLQKEHHIITTIKICEVLEGHRKSSAGFVFKYK